MLLDRFKMLYHRIRAALLRSRRYAVRPSPADLLADRFIDAALRRLVRVKPSRLRSTVGPIGKPETRTGRLDHLEQTNGETPGGASPTGKA